MVGDYSEMDQEKLVRDSEKHVGNCIISCRDAYADSSIRIKDCWKVISDGYDRNHLLSVGSQAVLIFVHGFNNDLVQAVGLGDGLLSNLHCAASRDTSEDPLRKVNFFTFCWRGDFYPDFRMAEDAADRLAPCFANFLSELHQQSLSSAHPVQAVLITHSLGARIALQALRSLSTNKTTPWIDCLLMIQPAISLGLVTKGTYWEAIPRRYTTPGFKKPGDLPDVNFHIPHLYAGPNDPFYMDPDEKHGDHVGPLDTEGFFFKTFAFAGEVFATMSGADSVLKNAYYQYSVLLDSSGIAYHPDLRSALGSLTEEDWLETRAYLSFPPNFLPIHLSPGESAPCIRDHGQVFVEDGQAIVDLLYEIALGGHVSP